MKKNFKKATCWVLILVICMSGVFLSSCGEKEPTIDYQKKYEETVLASEEKISALEKKIEELEKEKAQLEVSLYEKGVIQSDFDTQNQAVNDLLSIYKQMKNGDINSAKAQIEKIEPIGFDDFAMVLYELLSEKLK